MKIILSALSLLTVTMSLGSFAADPQPLFEKNQDSGYTTLPHHFRKVCQIYPDQVFRHYTRADGFVYATRSEVVQIDLEKSINLSAAVMMAKRNVHPAPADVPTKSYTIYVPSEDGSMKPMVFDQHGSNQVIETEGDEAIIIKNIIDDLCD